MVDKGAIIKLRIKEVIKEKGFTNKEVAKELNIDQNSLSRYITGRRKITLETAAHLAVILECSIDDLIVLQGYRHKEKEAGN